MQAPQIFTISLISLLLSACHNHKVNSVELLPVPESTSQVLTDSSVENTVINKVGFETMPVPTSAVITNTPKAISRNQEFIQSMNILGFETNEISRGVIVYLPASAHFATNSSDINSTMNSRLQQFVTETNKTYVSNRYIIVSGHTDAVGPNEANQELSTRRANAVESQLISLGSSISRLSSEGFGESSPRFTDNLNQHLNRRVEFLVLN